MTKKGFFKVREATFWHFLDNVEVSRAHDVYKNCYLQLELSIGGYDMVTRCWKHFVLKETHIFLDFVKSEGETVKNQLKSLPKKDFLKVHDTTFLSFS